ncbi:MAG: 4Fe-4S dicluster domain-containing protein [Dehalococcoidales bacterium]|nr:4Fe-4S dicluster domain-containing protein [Dehalococcoidales bacterium]
MPMKRVLVNEPVCMGCHLCEVYCQLNHSTSSDLVKAFKRPEHQNLPRLRIEARNPIFFSLRCQHCAEAPCISACLTGALSRDEKSGAVITDEAKCIGCWTCILACPYGAIKQDTVKHKSVKCDLCQGSKIPACVEHCPNEALVFEEVAEVKSK